MNSQSGMAALVIIIILSAASLIIAVSVSSIGIDEALLGYVSQKGDGAFYAADGSMEESLRRIRKDANYGVAAGTINLSLGNGSCTIDIVDLGSNQRRVTVYGSSGSFNKGIETTVSLSAGVLSINEWKEIN